jgi:hypothetical protein
MTDMNSQQNEIVLYQPDNSLQLEVRLEDETVWLSQAQMAELFQTTRNNITMHISNVFKEGELEKKVSCKDFLHITQHGAMKGATKTVVVTAYNLDVIISVGYRVRSRQGTLFRQWANQILKDYLLRGYAINQRFERVEKLAEATERRVTETEKKIDFFVRTSLPPVQGVFYEGQIFDAYTFAADLVKSAKRSLVLLDNYVDESVLLLLAKRSAGVKTKIITRKILRQLQLDVTRHNAQYESIALSQSNKFHDRFLLVDDTVYHIGASLKDLGKKLFAFSKMEATPSDILKGI